MSPLAFNISVCVPALSDHFVVHCNMTPSLSGHFSIFGLVFFVLKTLLGIARQWSREKFAILTLKPRSHVSINFNIHQIYQTWATGYDNSRGGEVLPYMGGIHRYMPLRKEWFQVVLSGN